MAISVLNVSNHKREEKGGGGQKISKHDYVINGWSLTTNQTFPRRNQNKHLKKGLILTRRFDGFFNDVSVCMYFKMRFSVIPTADVYTYFNGMERVSNIKLYFE